MKKMKKIGAIKLDNNPEWNMCLRKRKYTDIEKDYYAKQTKQRAYLCPHCNYWHLTKKKEES